MYPLYVDSISHFHFSSFSIEHFLKFWKGQNTKQIIKGFKERVKNKIFTCFSKYLICFHTNRRNVHVRGIVDNGVILIGDQRGKEFIYLSMIPFLAYFTSDLKALD